jgi:zinc/manganese transport system substrate-binding protein
MRFITALLFVFASVVSSHATIHIVAAENFYGEIAKQIGGDQVEVTSILTNPDQDPHLFTVDPRTAAAVEKADIVIVSGIDYDPWMDGLIAAHPNPHRKVLTVASFIQAKPGDNPHIWYNPETIHLLAFHLASVLGKIDAAHLADYMGNWSKFSVGPIEAKMTEIRSKYSGTDVLATEPVFGYMATALGFKMHAMDFQNHVMNNVEPTAQEAEEFENLLKQHQVKILFYNSQASDPIADRMKEIATAAGIPVVGVTETEPANTTYASWMLAQLDEVEKALAK